MSSTALPSNVTARVSDRWKRDLAEVLAPLNTLVSRSPNLLAKPGACFEQHGRTYELPRYLFLGPKGGDEPLRIGIFAGIHGDEPEGTYALLRFLQVLDARPELASGYCLFLYPICNPSGFEDNTRWARNGKDLNREFWAQSAEPEVRLLEAELTAHAFHGIIDLHTDDTSEGFYGFVRGATLTKHLLEPALQAAEHFVPRNCNERIDGFKTRKGIISEGYNNVLSAPPRIRPRPFEIVLEAPQAPPQFLKEMALVSALQTILAEYRKFIAYAANL